MTGGLLPGGDRAVGGATAGQLMDRRSLTIGPPRLSPTRDDTFRHVTSHACADLVARIECSHSMQRSFGFPFPTGPDQALWGGVFRPVRDAG
jgi:hypothetical protein